MDLIDRLKAQAAERNIAVPKTDAEMRALQHAYEAHALTHSGFCPVCSRYEDVRDQFLGLGYYECSDADCNGTGHNAEMMAKAQAAVARLNAIMAAPLSN